ncbi:MAG: TetR family transcriptional regulator [Actinobacteria bacterium]|nr:TetR family transcriptional regulator [Actinomycetota bacterium]
MSQTDEGAHHPVEATRRRLSSRQAATVARLVDAAVDELHRDGFDALTMRGVATRAGVSPATAYTYFSSKEHLVAEVFWRRLAALEPVTADRRKTAANRVAVALGDIALLVADEPEVAAGVSTAMLSSDPDVKLLRDRIGAATHRRIVAALGDEADAMVVRTLDLAVAGAMLNAGMGHLSYAELPALLADVATTVLAGSGRTTKGIER